MISPTTDKPVSQIPISPTPPIFNNPNIIVKGWYLVCPSKKLNVKQIRSFSLCGQRIALFRGEDGQVRALHAYCPHMGTDLGIGAVIGNQARCFFHHWRFDETGKCTHIPCQSHIPDKAQLPAYATEEKYGFIWVYPDSVAPTPVAEFDELKGRLLVSQADKSLTRVCHHHICMMNGIDAQHLTTVHNLSLEMTAGISPTADGQSMDFTMTGPLPAAAWWTKPLRWLIGDNYTYEMRYVNGNLGLLTLLKNARRLPALHMLYAYRPLSEGGAHIQPIYVTRKRSGPIGWLVSYLLLLATRLCYYRLRGEDGKIYDNIQFSQDNLLPIDTPLARYIAFVNQQSASCWSKYDLRDMQGKAQLPQFLFLTRRIHLLSYQKIRRSLWA